MFDNIVLLAPLVREDAGVITHVTYAGSLLYEVVSVRTDSIKIGTRGGLVELYDEYPDVMFLMASYSEVYVRYPSGVPVYDAYDVVYHAPEEG